MYTVVTTQPPDPGSSEGRRSEGREEDIWEEAVTMGEAVGQQNCRC